MDIRSEFKDLNMKDDSAPEELPILPADVDNEEEKAIVNDLQARIEKIKVEEQNKESGGAEADPEYVDGEEFEEEYEDLDEPTFQEKMQPFVLPIALTIFAIFFAGMFLYFFSKSRVENTAQAIVNAGVPEQVYYPPAPVPVVIKEEPLSCELPQILNEDGSACITPEPVPEPVVAKPIFENGTTTIINVRFSYDKFSYDNKPRGIYLLDGQIFEGDFTDFKLNPTNRAFANDYFFGVDRYTVSLIGDCAYVVDDARILAENVILNENNKTFSGNVKKVIESSKPRVMCGN